MRSEMKTRIDTTYAKTCCSIECARPAQSYSFIAIELMLMLLFSVVANRFLGEDVRRGKKGSSSIEFALPLYPATSKKLLHVREDGKKKRLTSSCICLLLNVTHYIVHKGGSHYTVTWSYLHVSNPFSLKSILWLTFRLSQGSLLASQFHLTIDGGQH